MSRPPPYGSSPPLEEVGGERSTCQSVYPEGKGSEEVPLAFLLFRYSFCRFGYTRGFRINPRVCNNLSAPYTNFNACRPLARPLRRLRKTSFGVRYSPKPVLELTWARQEHCKERTMSERVNARLKDEFGAGHIRVSGPVKGITHLIFGMVALAVDQGLRLTGNQA